MKHTYFLLLIAILVCSCNTSRFINRSAQETIFQNNAIEKAHVGISIYNADNNRYLYNYQGEKYFVPASNVKIATCYAAMKYLADSLTGLRYEMKDGNVYIKGTGDPTFLHPDFKNQTVFEFLKKSGVIYYPLPGVQPLFSPLGKGWAWDDYLDSYAAERSTMPIYGNVASFYMQGDTIAVSPSIFYNYHLKRQNEAIRNGTATAFTIIRPIGNNLFQPLSSPSTYQEGTKFAAQTIPFKTIDQDTSFGEQVLIKLLKDTLHKEIESWSNTDAKPHFKNIIHSQPTDSLLKPMMHRSDNFFAEQALLMVSDKAIGVMHDERIIDTLLEKDLKELPQKPRWVDGSGLSRYNLFTPEDFVFMLNRMQQEFGMKRIMEIFPMGNEGSLKNYFVADSNHVYAKTGTMSGVVALSGYLYTRKKKLLVFSVLVNNHRTSSTEVRQAVERFILLLRKKI